MYSMFLSTFIRSQNYTACPNLYAKNKVCQMLHANNLYQKHVNADFRKVHVFDGDGKMYRVCGTKKKKRKQSKVL